MANVTNATCYRIYTEDVNGGDVLDRACEVFEAFTAYHALGVWNHDSERTLIIEVIIHNDMEEKSVVKTLSDIRAFAVWVKEFNRQEAVLVTEHGITNYLW